MSKTFHALFQNVHVLDQQGDVDRTRLLGQLQFDSLRVQQGDVFVAVRGTQNDGHDYITKALKQGAAVVVGELEKVDCGNAVYVRVADSAEALGLLAANLYDHPSENMALVGITGTNGKTTTVTLLHQLFTALGYRCGLIGTVENRIGAEVLSSTHTTPDAVSLQSLLRKMAEAGCSHVFMEASSHAIHQRRIAGTKFCGAVFTNLTHDHLDYHGTFANYRDAKKRLFDDLTPGSFALVNDDDKNGAFMLQNTRADKHTYALKTPADFKAKIIETSLIGMNLQLDGEQVHTRLIGAFNASNLTAAYGVARLLGIGKMDALTALSNVRAAEGRFDYIVHPVKTGSIGIVDYAHTPDALEKVIETIQKLKKPASKLITVVGCGGDRDKTKRPVMARVAARGSEQLILTSDNPRSEDPAVILRDMQTGLSPEDEPKTLVIQDREQAIKTACQLLGNGDVLLLAGKGHEKYQEINGVKHPFDDKALLEKCFAKT